MKFNSNAALEKAESLGQTATESDVSQIDRKLPKMKRGPVKKIWDKVVYLWEKLKSNDVPLRLKITIAGALLYLILPLDMVPDALPALGLVDDVSVILLVFREVSRYAIPKISKKIEQKIYSACYEKIDMHLSELLKTTVINTVWTFLANASGCAILIFKPFGAVPSKITACVIFSAVFCYSAVRIGLYIKEYGKMTYQIVTKVFKNRSISKGVAAFVKEEYPEIRKVFYGLDVVKNFIPEAAVIPDLPQIIKTFEENYKKRVILFIVIFALYSALIWITKFLLMRY